MKRIPIVFDANIRNTIGLIVKFLGTRETQNTNESKREIYEKVIRRHNRKSS